MAPPYISERNTNYAATVVQLHKIHPHPNADKLACTNIFGNNVIVGINTKEGDTGLYFPLEAQLGLEFAQVNDLIRRKDENGKVCGGMFDENRRVRCQTLRGEKSEGFWIPIDSLGKLLNKTNESILQDYPVDTEIESINGLSISQKYIPVGTRVSAPPQAKKRRNVPKVSRLVDGQVHLHFDTSHLGKNLHTINPDSLISVTWKMHGSSWTTQRVLVKKQLKWYEKTLQKLGVDIQDQEYDYVYTSRNVIKNSNFNNNVGQGWYGEDLWGEIGSYFKNNNLLHKGESVYGEAVGFTKGGACIQRGYDYSCKQGEHKLYVYRITHTTADGKVIELPWKQVEARCVELGVEAVPTIYYGYAKDFLQTPQGDKLNVQQDYSLEEWRELLFNTLKFHYVYDQDSKFCKNKVPEEGIVVRVEHGTSITNYKLKSFAFNNHESKELDKGEIDMETEQNV